MAAEMAAEECNVTRQVNIGMAVAGLLLAMCLLVPVTGVEAQEGYPPPQDSFVNDYAGLLSAEDAVYVRSTLAQLREEHGVAAVVVTVHSFRDYGTGDESIESFATNLFNAWGIGHVERNDGVLLLVAVQDRLVRLELGSGYDEVYNDRMWTVINEHLVSDFRRGQYSRGIVSGVRALYRELTGQWPAAQPAPTARPTQAVAALPSSLPLRANPVPLASAPASNGLLAFFVIAMILAGAAILAWNVFSASDASISLNNVSGPRWSMDDESPDFSSLFGPASSIDNSSTGFGGSSSGSSSASGSADSSMFGGGQSSGGGRTGSW